MQLPAQLTEISDSLRGIVPELGLAVLFVLCLIAELLPGREDRVGRRLWLLSVAGASGVLVLVLAQWSAATGFRFGSMLFLDDRAVFFKVLVIGAWIFALGHIRLLRYRFPALLYALLTAAVLAMCLLCMATHWLTIYLSVELLSLSSYLLVALWPTSKAAEASLKYLLFGAISSAVMLYGISLLYGLSGTLDLTTSAGQLALAANTPLVTYVAMLMALGGLFFKLSLVPFHVWAPDVYEATPTPLVAFLSAAPKAAILLVLMRVSTALPATVLPLLGGVALLSITVGNVAALWQRNARRLLAYSSIAQAGYLVAGVAAFSAPGFAAAAFYAAAYVLLTLAAFILIDLLQPRSTTLLTDFSGLGRTQHWPAIALTLVMVALAGLPPTVGFTAKWLVFSALWDSYQQQGSAWLLWLLVGGLLNAAISLAYYLKLPYLLFFKESVGPPVLPASGRWPGVVAGVVLVVVLLFFFKPELLNLLR